MNRQKNQQNLQYARHSNQPRQPQGVYGRNAPAPSQKDFRRLIGYGIIAGAVGLLILGVVLFLGSRTSSDFATRTQDWVTVSNRDFGVALRYPREWNLNIGSQRLVELTVNNGDQADQQVIIEAIPNPDWLELNEWIPQLDTTGLTNQQDVMINGRSLVSFDVTDESRVYFVNSGPRIIRISTFEDSQEVEDLLQTLDVTAIARNVATDESLGGLIDFAPIAFKVLFDETNLADTRNIDNRPAIFGDAEADAKIQSLAETRGYILRSEYTGETQAVNGFPVASQIVDDWEALEAAAEAAGHDLDVTSGLRGIESQRDIFTSRLTTACANELGSDCSFDQIKNGEVDDIIDSVLQTTSIPGYSRHHSGYTVDIQHTGQGALEQFAGTDGYRWISEDNFANAKRFGFIPSYPDGVERQGPDPEPWEYVWVGRDSLRNFE